MIVNVYAMRDVKTGFLTPSFDSNDETAIRNFSHAVINSDSIIFSFAQDFSLYRIGSYDSDTGILSPEPLPVHLYEAVDSIRNFGGEFHA